MEGHRDRYNAMPSNEDAKMANVVMKEMNELVFIYT